MSQAVRLLQGSDLLRSLHRDCTEQGAAGERISTVTDPVEELDTP